MEPKKGRRRPQMLASVIREIIAPILRECPKECGIVSITDIDVSSDYGHAVVCISALTSPDIALTFLQDRSKELQQRLVVLERRKIPLLRFRIDPRTERGNRIDELLAE